MFLPLQFPSILSLVFESTKPHQPQNMVSKYFSPPIILRLQCPQMLFVFNPRLTDRSLFGPVQVCSFFKQMEKRQGVLLQFLHIISLRFLSQIINKNCCMGTSWVTFLLPGLNQTTSQLNSYTPWNEASKPKPLKMDGTGILSRFLLGI